MTAPGSRDADGRGQPELLASGGSGPAGPGPLNAEETDAPSAAETGAPAARGWAASPAVQGLLALVVYLAVWVLAEVLPLVLHPGQPQLDQASMDPNLFTWCLRWWPYAIGHGLNPLHTSLVAAPGGIDLAWITTVPPLGVLALPVTVLAGPVVSFNLLVALSVPLSGWAAFVLCRRLTGRFWPALAAGAVYGFSAYELNHIFAGQLNLAFSLLLPLMAYLVVLWRDGRIGSRVFVVLLAVAMALQCYLFLETFADLTAVWVLALLAGYGLAGRAGRPMVARLAGLVGVAYVLALLLAGPYLGYALTHLPPRYATSPVGASLDLASLVVPRPGQTFGLSGLARMATAFPAPTRDGYVGIPLLVLAVALVATAWRSKLTRFLGVMLVLLMVAALGPVVHLGNHRVVAVPWSGLWFLPILRSAYPARIMGFVFLALAVMVALWLGGQSAVPRSPWLGASRWLLALVAIAAIAANTPALSVQQSPGLPAFITSGQYRQYLHRGDIVVVISQRGNAGMLWQAETSFYTRLAGGYLNVHIARHTDLPMPVANLAKGPLRPETVQQFHAFLTHDAVAAILVDAGAGTQWPALLSKTGLHAPREVGGVLLYRLAH